MEEILGALLRALSFGTPLLLASLGAVINERAGVVNLGVEGMLALGALAGFAVAYDGANLWTAVGAGMLAGALASLLHAFVTITLRANQFVSGLALTMVGVGMAGLLGKRFEGMPLFLDPEPREWPFTLFAIALAVLLSVFLHMTRPGLVLRSVGENPASADVLGLSVARVRYLAVAFGGALAGMGGAYLSLVYRQTWTDNMSAGLGWIAVALVIFVGWNPLRAVFGAVFFGLLFYLQFSLQGNSPIPTEVFAAMPYVLVVVVLAFAGLRGQQGAAPEALGRPYTRGER
ncbi:ABC transporter permease [Deinococcus peraridilitoris]|uniref:Putative ABC-type transport system, permease component n=1 Tax=Deinococcus peraridilitoris (strain DSM 19664 / LMG 22246 / CIP 109416 / KR-200) TaxID=937777 RepID=K9ZVQ0_DEIPD|nr:ABC transporter permease [Deinococcus peraridilitoris]AFZ65693.1 putative ABC-type transport system, permease component [Deinococcus peraridilitoris DSM 19664]